MRRILTALLLLSCGLGAARAEWFQPPLQEVPIERLAENLRARIAEHPDDLDLRLNLARLYAMAYANKSPTHAARQESGEPWFGPWGGRVPRAVQDAADEAKAAEAKAWLDQAIAAYRELLARDAKHMIGRLGLGWCLAQAGDAAGARGVLRGLLADAWAEEGQSEHGDLEDFLYEEAARIYLPLLTAEADQAEKAEVEQRLAKLQSLPRPITPLALPLADGLAPEALLDPAARVAFDVDGQERPGRWSWIRPDAAWLVAPRRDGTVRSGLELFGSVTWWLFWRDGYQTLSALDDDGDGWLRGAELAGLALWRDLDADGVSDPGEVAPLSRWGVVGLACRGQAHAHPDVAAWAPGGVELAGGERRDSFDLLLRYHAPD